MQRMVWLGHLFGMLILLSAVYRVALANPGIDNHQPKGYATFQRSLNDIGVSSRIVNISRALYKLFSITQLPLTYSSYRSMEAILDASWEKGAILSSKLTDKEKAEIKNTLSKTPVKNSYYKPEHRESRITPYSEAHQSLIIFFSSHAQPMIKNLNRLKEITKNIANGHSFPANILLVSSTTSYDSDELSHLKSSPLLSERFKSLLHGNQRISQSSLAEDMLWQSSSQWSINRIITFDKSQHFSQELENTLSQYRNYAVYSNVILATIQPYCEEAKTIVHNKLKHKYAFYHSCLDFYTSPSAEYQPMDIIADSLNALRHLIKTENRYYNLNENVRY